MSGPSVAATILAKDLLLDFRTRERIGHMAVFALLVVALLSIVLPSACRQCPEVVSSQLMTHRDSW